MNAFFFSFIKKILIIAAIVTAIAVIDEFLNFQSGSFCSSSNKRYPDNVLIGGCNFSLKRFFGKAFLLFLLNCLMAGIVFSSHIMGRNRYKKMNEKEVKKYNWICFAPNIIPTFVGFILFVLIFIENPSGDYCRYTDSFSYVKLAGGWCRPDLIESNVLLVILEVFSFAVLWLPLTVVFLGLKVK